VIEMKKSVFKTEAGRDKIRAYYNRVLDQFPFGQRYVGTTFGQTFMLTAGHESNPPIILLHGSCSNSAFWFPEIFALWMKDVLDALGLERAFLVGNSLGGWMALKFATAYPERVSKLILISSSGLAQIRPQFLINADQTRQPKGTVPVSTSIFGEQSIPKEVLDFMNLIVENYDPIQELPVFADEQLQRLNMPVFFIDGENDAIIDAQKSAQRLSGLIPSALIRLLPNCGHAVANSAEYIIPFLMKAH